MPQVFAALDGVAPDLELWRYMSFRDFLSMLNGRLRLTQIARFPDRHEGRILAGTQQVEAAIAADWASRLGRGTPNLRAADSRYRQVTEMINRHLAYASCWTSCGPERPEMWLAYTNSVECVAIRTSAERMSKIPCAEEVLQLSPVHYYADPVQVPYSPFGVPSVLNKRSVFEFEREVRLVSFRPPEITQFDHVEKYPLSIFRQVPDDFILEVVTHPESSEEWIESVAGVVNAFHRDIEVRQSNLYRFG